MHTMLDLETLATDSNAQIISIGAVNFNKNEILGRLKLNVIPDPADVFTTDPQTALWWIKQSQEARDALWYPEGVRLKEALRQLNEFGKLSTGLWGNGATFDNVILRNAYLKMKVKCNWRFREDRCYRTIINICPNPAHFKRLGPHHDALADAETQASYLMFILNSYNLPLL